MTAGAGTLFVTGLYSSFILLLIRHYQAPEIVNEEKYSIL
jgi:hypothetical protein